jgi:multiple sugar transport system ATP-binding protein
MIDIRVSDCNKSYGALKILKHIDLEIERGEFVVLLGPSGCGKSTLLHIIAGLESLTSGAIEIGGRDVTDVEPKDRDIAMVFQSYALYPTMTVRKNMEFGLRMRGKPLAEIRPLVEEKARMLNIDHLLDRRPSQLSGGQRQRVAIGRALVRDPKVFLFDEPLSNLDAKLRSTMRTEIKKLHQTLGTTSIYVTHDQLEAMTLATRMVVMKAGEIQQVGRPDEVYHRPANLFVADFLGNPGMNFLPGRLRVEAGRVHANVGATAIRLDGYGFRGPPEDGMEVVVGLRPEAIRLAKDGDEFALELRPTVVEHTGSETFVVFALEGREIIGKFPTDAAPTPGATTRVAFELSRLSLFDKTTEQRL